MRGSRKLIVIFFVLCFAVLGCEKEPASTGSSAEAETSANLPEAGKETAMSINVQWLNHASFRITHGETVIYIDPWKLTESPCDATMVLVSHSHHDHYSASDIGKVSGLDTKLVASADVISQEGKGQAIKPGETIQSNGVSITAVAAYNPNKQFHPKANNWLGFVIEIDSKRIYYAGDTDMTDEMKSLKDIDLALLPVGGTYTMNAAEAAEAVNYFKPDQAVGYHWGDIIGSKSDAEEFSKSADCKVTVLNPGESLEL
jgi:L-ascorbate metabolism protein UlaG (beta-lactamase superfamily)